MPVDIGALDAKSKNKGKGKSKDKPDAEVTCYYCSKVGHRKADCWSWQAAQKEKDTEEASADVDVGSIEVGPLSACASGSWILSVEVAEIDKSWTTHSADWVMVDSGAGVPVCPVDCAPECEVKHGSVKLPLVGVGGDRIEHIGQTTGGYATRNEWCQL